MFESRIKKTSNFQSHTDASIQRKQGSGAAIKYMDNRQSTVAQMESEKNPVQRKLTMRGSFDGAVFDGETDDETIFSFVDELIADDFEYEEKGITRKAIFLVVRDLANNGDHTLYESDLKELLLPKELEEAPDNNELSGFNDTEDEIGSKTIKIGKRVFDGDDWHHTIKETIKNTIGVKKLSLLAYKDSKHHNFDFWIGKDGRIWVGINNSGGHEKPTDYILTMDNKVVKD